MSGFKPYDDTIKAIIDEKNLPELTGYSVEEFASLTGIDGIRPLKEIKIVVTGRYPIVQVIILSDKVDLERSVRIKAKIIHNELLKSHTDENGIGWRMVESQILAARKAGFQIITLEAARGIDPDGTRYEGYQIWHKLGFLMTEDSLIKFRSLMNKEGRVENDIYELYQTKEGEEFWVKHGFTWDGEFDLRDGSRSLEIWQPYLTKKKKPR